MYHIFKKYLWSGIGILFLFFSFIFSLKLNDKITSVLFSVIITTFIISLVPVAIYERHKNNKLNKMQIEIIENEHKNINKH